MKDCNKALLIKNCTTYFKLIILKSKILWTKNQSRTQCLSHNVREFIIHDLSLKIEVQFTPYLEFLKTRDLFDQFFLVSMTKNTLKLVNLQQSIAYKINVKFYTVVELSFNVNYFVIVMALLKKTCWQIKFYFCTTGYVGYINQVNIFWN